MCKNSQDTAAQLTRKADQATHTRMRLYAPPNNVAEVVHGALCTHPRPAMRHAWASSVLGSKLGEPFNFGRGGPGGFWILDEPELHLGDDIVAPDPAGWRYALETPVATDGTCICASPRTLVSTMCPSTRSRATSCCTKCPPTSSGPSFAEAYRVLKPGGDLLMSGHRALMARVTNGPWPDNLAEFLPDDAANNGTLSQTGYRAPRQSTLWRGGRDDPHIHMGLLPGSSAQSLQALALSCFLAVMRARKRFPAG